MLTKILLTLYSMIAVGRAMPRDMHGTMPMESDIYSLDDMHPDDMSDHMPEHRRQVAYLFEEPVPHESDLYHV